MFSDFINKIFTKHRFRSIQGIPFYITTGFLIVFSTVFTLLTLSHQHQEKYIEKVDKIPVFDISYVSELSVLPRSSLIFASMIGIYMSVLLHELGHATAAQRYSSGVTEIRLWAFGGLAALSDETNHPRTEFLVTAAGPAVTLALAITILPIAVLTTSLTSPFVTTFLTIVGLGNVAMFVFNLLPVFPLDGGRLTRSLIAKRMGYERATLVTTKFGTYAGLVLVALSVLAIAPVTFLFGLLVRKVCKSKHSEMMEKQELLSYPKFTDSTTIHPKFKLDSIIFQPIPELSDTNITRIQNLTREHNGMVMSDSAPYIPYNVSLETLSDTIENHVNIHRNGSTIDPVDLTIINVVPDNSTTDLTGEKKQITVTDFQTYIDTNKQRTKLIDSEPPHSTHPQPQHGYN